MATSLLDWIMDLMRDGSAREAFNANPQAAMASAGFTNVCGSDVRAALIDEPSIREVAGVSLPHDVAGVSEPDIRYIINNYTIEAPSVEGDNIVDGPTNDGPDVGPITGDGNTVVQEEANTTTQEDNDVDDSTDNSIDSTIDNDTETETEAGNIVTGDGSAGEDQITDSTISGDSIDGIFQGDGNTNLLVLQENLNDLHALSDLVNVDDTLNGSLNGSLNNLATNALQNAEDLVSILG
jgi:hypothetical protein